MLNGGKKEKGKLEYREADGSRLFPKAFGVDKSGNIYIDDTLVYSRIQVVDKNGNYIKKIQIKTE